MVDYSKDFDIIAERTIECLRRGGDFALGADGKPFDLDAYEAGTVPGEREGERRFADVDYDCNNGATWRIGNAMSKVVTLAKYYYVAEGEEKERAFKILVEILRDYASHKYENPNWWQNDIGIPINLKNVLLLTRGKLPRDVEEGLIWYMDHGSCACHPNILTVKNAYHSGANLIWYCSISIVHGIITNNAQEILDAIGGIAAETYGGYEGIQPDGSFFQHGRRLYSLGYGRAFFNTIAPIFFQVSGTALDFTDEVKGNVARHVLDGMRYMIGGNGADYAAAGREYTRLGATNITGMAHSLRFIVDCPEFPRRDEFEDFYHKLKAGVHPIEGVKYFPVARFLSLHTKDLYISFKGTDNQMTPSEICTGENYLGINLSYGTNCTIMREGNEYADIGFIWDYAALPGTTCRYESDEELKAYPDFTFKRLEHLTDFGGGQQGDLAAAFIGGERYETRATVSAFAFPFGMAILGAGLGESNGKPIHTTVNQCHAKGEVKISERGDVVEHRGVVYRNLDPLAPMRAGVSYRETDHRRNNYVHYRDSHSGYVFTLDIPTNPAHPEYAYLILPKEEETRGVEVIMNTENIQAVAADDGRIIAVFHKAGEFEYNGKLIKGGDLEVVFA